MKNLEPRVFLNLKRQQIAELETLPGRISVLRKQLAMAIARGALGDDRGVEAEALGNELTRLQRLLELKQDVIDSFDTTEQELFGGKICLPNTNG